MKNTVEISFFQHTSHYFRTILNVDSIGVKDGLYWVSVLEQNGQVVIHRFPIANILTIKEIQGEPSN